LTIKIMATLNETLNTLFELGYADALVPQFIKDNLQHAPRPYQEEAFRRFIYYLTEYKQRNDHAHLLFQMATGSGKTLVMAGTILYLYAKGYRNFLFFVNSTNIINKTRENFLNPQSSKYLFTQTIEIEGQKINVREVDNFDSSNPDDINILFSTVAGLHSRFNIPRENSITYADIADKEIILMSDEAHHINALTKKSLTITESQDLTSWEHTVNSIFRANQRNMMLEFTATLELSHEAISKKYADKIVFDYPLSKFREDGYSKEVKTLQSDLKEIDRAVQGIILSQFRLKILNKNGLQIKPVILMKSKTVKESEQFEEDFHKILRNLSTTQIQNIRSRNQNNDVIDKAFKYFDSVGISAQNLIDELAEDFSEEKCISVNSQNDSEEKQIVINTLEDKDNEYRVVFAVDKLNEGWDVLNLYDIVRLYETRDSKSGKPGKSTVSEAQLIGRGARYCPFQTDDNQEKYQRKFDKDVDNELKIAEELHYHASYNPRYIQELNTALKETGIIADDTIERKLTLKDNFKQTDIYKKGIIFLNKRIPNTVETEEFRSPEIRKQHKYTFHTGLVKETTVFGNDLQMKQNTTVRQYTLKKFNRQLLKKAINQFDPLQFSELKKWFPLVKSIDDFIDNEKYLGEVKVTVTGVFYKAEFAVKKQQFEVAKYVLSEILKGFKATAQPHIGTKRFEPHQIKQIFKEKTLRFHVSNNGESEVGKSILRSDIPNDLSTRVDTRDWHSYTDNFGTSEEKYLVKFIDSQMNELKEKYSEIHLLRNERFFQLYNFEDGKPLEPDYLLYLKEKNTENQLFYQLFIEPKGEQLIEKDKWKQDFLQSIEKEAQLVWNFQNPTYKVIGLPFYNEKIQKSLFGDKLKEALNY